MSELVSVVGYVIAEKYSLPHPGTRIKLPHLKESMISLILANEI